VSQYPDSGFASPQRIDRTRAAILAILSLFGFVGVVFGQDANPWVVSRHGEGSAYRALVFASFFPGSQDVLAGREVANDVQIWTWNEDSGSLVLVDTIRGFGNTIHDLATGDLDDDGDTDIVVGVRGFGLAIAWNEGGLGNWRVDAIDAIYSWEVHVADFDLDGRLDILHGTDRNYLRIFYGDGAGGFSLGSSPTLPAGHTYNAARNFSVIPISNGRPGIIGLPAETRGGVTGYYLRAFVNQPLARPAGPFWQSVGLTDPMPAISGASSSTAADIDGNGYPDQILPLASGELAILRGGIFGEETWRQETIDTLPVPAAAVLLHDLDGNGFLDIAVGYDTVATGLSLYWGDARGQFPRRTTVPTSFGVGGRATLRGGDADGNGLADFVASVGSDGFALFRGVAPASYSLTRLSEWVHPVAGGTPIVLFGSGFRAGMHVRVGGVEIQNPTILDAGRISAIVPPGTEIRDVSGALRGSDVAVWLAGEPEAVLFEALTYVSPIRPRGVELLSCTLVLDAALLRWRNPIHYDDVTVYRDIGSGELTPIATLPGDSEEYRDPQVSASEGVVVRYVVEGWVQLELRASAPATCIAVQPICELIRSTSSGTPRSTDSGIPTGSRSLTANWFSLRGERADEISTVLRFVEAVEFLEVETTASRVAQKRDAPPHRLIAELRSLGGGPGVVGKFGLASAPGRQGWSIGRFFADPPLAPGDWLLTLFVEGGTAAEIAYYIPLDANDASLANCPECPPPPYPFLRARNLTRNLDPAVSDIIWRRPDPENDLFVEFSVSATDPDGVITSYEWDFKDGSTRSLSASPTVAHTFPDEGRYSVGVWVTDDRCSRVFYSVDIVLRPQISVAPGEPPQISDPTPAPGTSWTIPNLPDLEVLTTYSVLVTPAPNRSVRTVRMELIHPTDDGVIYLAGDAEPMDASAQSYWRATFDMSDLPNPPAVSGQRFFTSCAFAFGRRMTSMSAS
jgi:hypothetical protein